MPDKRATYCLLTLLMVSLSVYAVNSKVIPSPGSARETCNVVSWLCKQKLCKVHTSHKPVQKVPEKNSPAAEASSPANTFENFIAPFIKTISPHFYEKIIKKETKVPEYMKSREA